MEYLKIFLPFIIGVGTTPIVESIKNYLSFQKTQDVVMSEIAELIESIPKILDDLLKFMENFCSKNGVLNISLSEDLYSPPEISLIFLETNIEDMYFHSPNHSKLVLKGMLCAIKNTEGRRKNICSFKNRFGVNTDHDDIHHIWSIYYDYLQDICLLKGLLEFFVLDENSMELYKYIGECIKRECEKRKVNYQYIMSKSKSSKQSLEYSKFLPD